MSSRTQPCETIVDEVPFGPPRKKKGRHLGLTHFSPLQQPYGTAHREARCAHEPCAHECWAHEPCASKHTGSAQRGRRSAPLITRSACEDAALSKERFNASAMPQAGLKGAKILKARPCDPTGASSSGLAIEHAQQPRWDRCHQPKACQLRCHRSRT